MKYTIGLGVLVLACSCVQPTRENRSPQGLLEGVADGATQVVDLTHALNSKNPYWPGPGYGPFEYETFATLEKDGVLSGRFRMAEHTGTHLDAPNHFVSGQIPLDQIPLRQLICPAVVIDLRSKASANPDYGLTKADITEWEQAHGVIPENSLVFVYTGWDERWTDYARYKNASPDGVLHFPGFSAEAAQTLVEDRKAAGLGIDTLSVDPGISKDFAVHHIAHGKGKYHIENAAHLSQVPASGAIVIVAPIKIENGTGGPARVLALIRSDNR